MCAMVTPTSGFATAARDTAARRLGTALRTAPSRRTVLMGDLNGTLDDRTLSAATSPLHSAQAEAGAGSGLTWPVSFPVARTTTYSSAAWTPARPGHCPPRTATTRRWRRR
ncbi:hypothetical protein ACFT8W_39660 [Streptomyces hygroscopicus]|uniref:hypothetical protein n=1 Tax=Streptomyces hygroscopicus TaxID=1912 RepID=UPI00362CCF4C